MDGIIALVMYASRTAGSNEVKDLITGTLFKQNQTFWSNFKTIGLSMILYRKLPMNLNWFFAWFCFQYGPAIIALVMSTLFLSSHFLSS